MSRTDISNAAELTSQIHNNSSHDIVELVYLCFHITLRARLHFPLQCMANQGENEVPHIGGHCVALCMATLYEFHDIVQAMVQWLKITPSCGREYCIIFGGATETGLELLMQRSPITFRQCTEITSH